MKLSPRMIEIVRCASEGLSLDQSAFHLGLSTTMVSHYRNKAIARLGARNLTHAVVIALKHGLIEMETAS